MACCTSPALAARKREQAAYEAEAAEPEHISVVVVLGDDPESARTAAIEVSSEAPVHELVKLARASLGPEGAGILGLRKTGADAPVAGGRQCGTVFNDGELCFALLVDLDLMAAAADAAGMTVEKGTVITFTVGKHEHDAEVVEIAKGAEVQGTIHEQYVAIRNAPKFPHRIHNLKDESTPDIWVRLDCQCTPKAMKHPCVFVCWFVAVARRGR